MEELKNKLHESIENLGTLHPTTIKISQELDLIIIEEMRK